MPQSRKMKPPVIPAWLVALLCCMHYFPPLCLGFSLSSKKKSNPNYSAHDDNNRSRTASDWNRRSFLVSSSLVVVLWPGNVVAPVPLPSNLEPRCNVDVGGGFDLLADKPLSEKDVVYPPSMEGLWMCNRVVTQVEGNQFQAGEAWRSFGGGNLKVNKAELYPTRYIRSPRMAISGSDNNPSNNNSAVVVNDRGFKLSQRVGDPSKSVAWRVEEPDLLGFKKARLVVKNRSVELPSDKGFGFNKLVCVDNGPFTWAIQIKRRYRQAFDEESGNRTVEGLEIVKTFRVLDGVARTEFPTSTVKSWIRLRRSS